MITKCGCDCSECCMFQKECNGCKETCGKAFWVEEHIKDDTCPIYKCCGNKEVEDCGKCSEMPCKQWYDLKNPSRSDEEHIKSISKRVKRLKEKQD